MSASESDWMNCPECGLLLDEGYCHECDEAAPESGLKPCPFCGGDAERFTIGEDDPNNAGGDVICCTKCQASSHVEFGRKENLVSRWNSRVQVQS